MSEFRSILVLATTFRSSHTHKNELTYYNIDNQRNLTFNFQCLLLSSYIYHSLTQSINQFFNLNFLSNNLPNNTTNIFIFVLFALYEYFWKYLIFWSCFLLPLIHEWKNWLKKIIGNEIIMNLRIYISKLCFELIFKRLV